VERSFIPEKSLGKGEGFMEKHTLDATGERRRSRERSVAIRKGPLGGDGGLAREKVENW